MTCYSIELPGRAARNAVAVGAFLLTLGFTQGVLAQEEPPAEGTDAGAPAEGAAPAEGTAIDPETLEVVPVDTAEPAEAAAPGKEGTTQLDTIEVTGSRIKRSDYETESPILIIKREDLDRAGLVSIGDILQNLPQAGAALSRSFNNGGNGATEIDLRNLGSNRVLVLVNGRRWVGGVSAFNTNAVDLNTIPISVIDSIEILKDGASAIYGSDAIAGVINIKTRRDYVGAEVRSHYESTQEGDGVSKLLTFSGGTVAGKTSVFFDVSYVDQGELSSGDREQTDIPKFGIPRDNGSRGSSFSPYGRFIVVPTSNNAQAINAAGGVPQGGVLSPCPDIASAVAGNPIGLPVGSAVSLCDWTINRGTFVLGDPATVDVQRFDANLHGHNYAPVNYLITPNERTGIFGQVSHQVLDNLRFSSEVLYNMRKSTQQLAETPDGLGDALGVKPFDWGYVSSTNPFNPTNPQSPYYIPSAQAQDIGRSDPGAGLVGLGAVLRRFTELGPRIFSQNVDTMRVAGGLDGSFEQLNRLFSWDAGFAFGENRLSSTDENLINNDRLARASGPIEQCVSPTTTDPTGQIGTVSVDNPQSFGCVPMDWFGGPGSLTSAMLDYVRYTAVDSSKQRQRMAYGNISSEIGELSKYLAGPLGMAAGFEYREELFAAQPDPLKVNQTSSTNSVGPTRGTYEVKEGYLELRAPVLAERKWIEELELSLAGRYSKYTSFGDNLSGKLGVRYKPIEELILRSTYSTAFRAPAITDLYLGQAVSYPVVVDPCTSPANATVAQNCGSAAGATQITSQIPTVFGGNPDLDPETAETLSAGFVYSPEFLPDFNFYLDWYRIDAEDFISALGPEAVLDLCYSAQSPQYCDAVHRNASGSLIQIDAVFQNFAKVSIEGVDFNFDWILPLPEYITQYAPGQFQWVFDAAYVDKFDTTVPTATGEETIGTVGVEFGGFGAIPRWKFNTGLIWRLGDWEAAWNVRYIHHVWEVCDDGFQDPGAQGEILENPTPILSLEQYGLCSDPNNPSPLFGADGSTLGKANELKATIYNDIQGGWSVPNWNSKLVFGVVNFLDQDPPASRSAFADSYDKATYDPWGSRTPYVRFQISF